MKVLSSLKSAKARHRDCKIVRRRASADTSPGVPADVLKAPAWGLRRFWGWPQGRTRSQQWLHWRDGQALQHRRAGKA